MPRHPPALQSFKHTRQILALGHRMLNLALCAINFPILGLQDGQLLQCFSLPSDDAYQLSGLHKFH